MRPEISPYASAFTDRKQGKSCQAHVEPPSSLRDVQSLGFSTITMAIADSLRHSEGTSEGAPSERRACGSSSEWFQPKPRSLQASPAATYLAQYGQPSTGRMKLPCGREEHSSLEVTHRVPTMVQFFWQDDLVNVSKFICACMDVMLGADSDDQSQTSDQP